MRPAPRLGLVLLAAAACATGEAEAPARPAEGPARADAAASAPERPSGADSVLLATADAGRILGDPVAPVWLVMLSDFQCPYCKRFHDDTWPLLEREYVRTGKVRAAFINFPLNSHRHAVPAAEWAMCAAVQGRFWPMHDAIFATQTAWSALADATSAFRTAAQRSGVDVAAAAACVAAHQTLPLVRADFDRGAAVGVNSTPQFLIGATRIQGAYPIEEFRRVIDAELQKRGSEEVEQRRN
jgi:protein-disulfide isomerase